MLERIQGGQEEKRVPPGREIDSSPGKPPEAEKRRRCQERVQVREGSPWPFAVDAFILGHILPHNSFLCNFLLPPLLPQGSAMREWGGECRLANVETLSRAQTEIWVLLKTLCWDD